MDSVVTPWDRARKYLPFSYENEELVFVRLMSEKAHLWTGNGFAVVTEVSDEGFLHVWLAGGDMHEMLDALPAAESFAHAMDCRGLEVNGRKGWRRVMKKFGFVPCGENMLRKYYGR